MERRRLGLSQADMAAIGDVSSNSQVNYEGNKRSPDTEYLARLSTAGVDVAYVVSGQHTAALPKSEGDLVEKLRRADPIDQQTIARVIDAIVDDKRGVSVNPADNLPDKVILKQMFGTLLSVAPPGAGEEETAEFLARHLESALRAMEGDWEIRIDPDYKREEDAPQQRRA